MKLHAPLLALVLIPLVGCTQPSGTPADARDTTPTAGDTTPDGTGADAAATDAAADDRAAGDGAAGDGAAGDGAAGDGAAGDGAAGDGAADAAAADAPAAGDTTGGDGATQVAAADAAAQVGGPTETMETAQWGGSPQRNNIAVATNIPSEWNVGSFDRDSGAWQPEKAKNIKWVAKVGSQTYGNPVVAGGKVFVGTNNGAGWLERYPAKVDLGCLLCFNQEDGEFLWQHSSEKLPTGRVHDWPLQGICCAPLVEGNRMWFVTSRGEVRCLDTEGFHDDENDGPVKDEEQTDKNEADVVWVFDMMKELGVSQHNMAACSVTAVGDVLFVNTSNGLDETHINLPAPDAPSFIALDKKSGKALWTDGSPGLNILHGQWSSPACGELGGVPQVIFGGGDGWVYSFHGSEWKDGKPQLLWKFDANPKETKWIPNGQGTRNNIIATPVIYNGRVYVAVGQDPEHGEGPGNLWCIDPTKRGDVSPQLAFSLEKPDEPLPARRIQAVIAEDSEVARSNPNSAVIWRYHEYDQNGDDKIDFEETMHRSCGTVAIQDGLLFIADFSGLFHCLDPDTGKPYWTHDMLAAAWGSPLIVDGKVYIGDEEGDVSIFKLSKEPELISEVNMKNSVYSTPIVAGGVMYISNKSHLFAIEQE